MDHLSSFQLDWRNIVGLVLSVLVAFISGPGGQGGGSFYIPLFSVLLGFSTNDAQALSASVVFFGCITMVAQAVATSHPQLPAVPVIDYTLVLAMTPSLMLGLGLGVLLNAVLSQWLINLLVISVWTWSTIQLCFTYKKTSTKEKQHLERKKQEKQQQQQQQQQRREKPAADISSHSQELKVSVVASSSSCAAAAQHNSEARSKPVQSNMRKASNSLKVWAAYQPWRLMSFICLLFGFFITIQVVRGTVTPACSVGYWVLLGVLAAVSTVAAVVVSVWLLRQSKDSSQSCRTYSAVLASGIVGEKGDQAGNTTGVLPTADPELAQTLTSHCGTAAHGTPGTQGQIAHSDVAQQGYGVLGSVVQFTGMRLAKTHVQMVIAGLMLGAWPLSPIILAMPGMHPQVAAGTSKLMLFMITGGTGISFLASGRLNITYLLVYGLTNALATPLGVWVVDKVIKRTGRPSYIIMLTIVRLAACVVVQAAFQAVPSLIQLAHGLPRAGFLPHGACPRN